MTQMGEQGGARAKVADAKRRRRKQFRIFGAVVTVAAIGGGIYWFATRNLESTDDAFIEADVVQIAPQVGGMVAALHFTDNQWVQRGQPLIEIDPQDYQAQLDSAKANLAVALAARQAAEADLDLTRKTTGAAIDQARHGVEEAKELVSEARQQADAASADATRAASDVKRYQSLLHFGGASQQRFEQAEADARATNARWRAAQLAGTAAVAQEAQARAKLVDALAAPQRIAQKEAQLANVTAKVQQARAELQAAELNLSYTRIVAPSSGRMAKRAVNVGDVVQKNQALAALVVDPPWVIANFKETQLTRMRPGQPVSVRVDALPRHLFHGRVDSFQPGTGARFSLLPPENATGNYVKVVQRVPVKIVFDHLDDQLVHQLAPGMSVVPEVDVAAKPGTGK